MTQATEEITDRLIGAVKADKPFYTLKDLISYGYPKFIVERIRLDINERLKDELVLPNTDWVDWQNDFIEDAWNDFKQAAFSNSVIPKNKLYNLTESVIHDVIKVYIEPRAFFAEYIFRDRQMLDFEEIIERTGNLTVHKHFGRAIPLYMRKRKLEKLDKDRCKLLIQKLDANLVASYSPDDWAKALELLFNLFGGKVDKKLIQKFFEDKELYQTANAFKTSPNKIDKDQFIQILSNPDLLNDEIHLNQSQQTTEKQNQTEYVQEELTEQDEEEEANLIDQFSAIEKEEAEEEEEGDESLNALFRTEDDHTFIAEKRNEDEAELSTKKKGNDTTRFHENLASVLDLAADSFKSISGEEEEELVEEKEPFKAPQDEKIVEKTEEEKPEEAEEIDDAQMWQQFLTKEHRETLLWKSDEQKEDDEAIFISEEDLIEEPPFDKMPVGEAPKQETDEDLRVYLMGQEVFLIEEIFNGSEDKYQAALDKLMLFSTWDEAADYIHKEIFSSQKVDMYSEAAVDFIDQLQSYFNKYKN